MVMKRRTRVTKRKPWVRRKIKMPERVLKRNVWMVLCRTMRGGGCWFLWMMKTMITGVTILKTVWIVFFSKELHSDQFQQDKEHNVNDVDFIRNSVKAVKNPVFPLSENDGANIKEKVNGHENSMVNKMVEDGMIDERGKTNNENNGNIDFLKKTVKAVQNSPEGNTGSDLKRDDRNSEKAMLGDERENYFAVDSNMDHFIQEQKNKGNLNFLKKAVKGIENGLNKPATAYDLNLYSNYEKNLGANARPRAKIGAAGLFPDSNLVLHNEGQKSMDNGYISTAKGAKDFPDVSILFKNPISRVVDESNRLRRNEYDSLGRADALAPRRQMIREATTVCASTEGSAATTMGRPEAQTPSTTQAAVTGGTVGRAESSATGSSVAGSSVTEKYVSDNNTNSTQYNVEDEKLILSITNKVTDAIFAQASAYSSLRNGLGICRKSNLNEIKGSKELKEQGSDEVVGQIVKCVTNLLKSHVGNQKCMVPDEPLHEFLVWMVRTGDPMHARGDVAPKQDLSKSEFLFPTMCNDTAANNSAASRPSDHKVAYM
uniref:Uncharacterized protein n=1 Tax=Clastoptera arizonana TaxID=38151 RepID=A0A1B6ED39_9HEMI